ncbi:MAG TPA: KpsF/GutQ family sugar-phosphate isomerase [Pseudomonadales bacterium]
MSQKKTFQQSGKKVIEVEARALSSLVDRIDARFDQACERLLSCKGRIVVTGMGKSGHIGKKLAATFASTGTAAFFVHPGEAGHGDLGMITADDLVLAISYSGNTDEIITLLPIIKRLGVPLISLTGAPRSRLAEFADINLDVSVAEEACPLGLAPTASTTATLAMGDALAIALLEARGFTTEDFAMSHPAGTLGRKLLLMVQDVMRTGNNIPKVNPEATISNALVEISAKGLGMTAIVDGQQLKGVFTDGDLRRSLDQGYDLMSTTITDVMTSSCKTVKPHDLAAEAVKIMETNKVTGLLVLDDQQQLVGVLNIHDLFRAGVM